MKTKNTNTNPWFIATQLYPKPTPSQKTDIKINCRRNSFLTAAAALALLVNNASAATWTWTGAGVTSGNFWTTTDSWSPASTPAVANTTDVIISGTTNVGDMYTGAVAGYTVRSLTFDATNDADTRLRIARTTNVGSGAVNLTFSANSGNATLTVESGSTGDKTIDRSGGYSTSVSIFLTSSLDIIHNGSGMLSLGNGDHVTTFGAKITGAGGINKSGTGTLSLPGNNAYSGSTIINAGSVVGRVGGSCANSAVSVAATSGKTATLGIAITDNTKLWTCASLIVNNAGTSSDLNFDFTSVSPSATVAPLVITGAATYTTTPPVTVALGASSSVAAGNSYPLIARASSSGTEPTAVTVTTTTPSTTITAHLAVTGTTNYLVIDTIVAPQPLRWAVSGAGTWDTSSINWTNNLGTPTAFTSGDQVRFDETYITAPTTVTLNMAVTPASVTVSNPTHDYTISGSGDITGAIPLTKDGAAKLTLTTTNTYSGTTTITAGTLELGDGTIDGTINNSASVVNSGTLAFNCAGSNTYAGVISGSGTVTKLGAGTQSLSVANTYTGDTTINDGILQGNAVNSFGASTNTRTITVNTGGTLYFNVAALFGAHFSTNVPTLVINAGGTAGNTKINGNNPLNNLTLNGGVLTSTSGQSTWGAWNINGTVTATGNSTITNSGGANQHTLLASGTGATNTTMNVVNASDLLTITTSLQNGRDTASPYTAHATGLTKTGAGTLTLSGTNTYTGGTTISQGTLALGDGGTGGSLSTNSAIVNNGNLTVNQSDAVTQGTDFSGRAITGSGSLTKIGSGTLTLSATNTYTGATSVSNGVLQLTLAEALASDTAVNISTTTGAKIDIAPGVTVTVKNLTVDGKLLTRQTFYSSSNLPNVLSGGGFLYTLEGGPKGTMVRFF